MKASRNAPLQKQRPLAGPFFSGDFQHPNIYQAVLQTQGSHFQVEPTSASNAAFDARLRCDDPRRDIRDLAAVQELADQIGMLLVTHIEMPANNRYLVWQGPATTSKASARARTMSLFTPNL